MSSLFPKNMNESVTLALKVNPLHEPEIQISFRGFPVDF